MYSISTQNNTQSIGIIMAQATGGHPHHHHEGVGLSPLCRNGGTKNLSCNLGFEGTQSFPTENRGQRKKRQDGQLEDDVR